MIAHHFSHCLIGKVGIAHQSGLKRPPQVFGSFLAEEEGDKCSSNGPKHPAATCILNILPHSCRTRSQGHQCLLAPKKKLPQASSLDRSCLAVIFAQQLQLRLQPRQPRCRDHKPAQLRSWQWILGCLWQRLSGLAMGFFASYQDIYLRAK